MKKFFSMMMVAAAAVVAFAACEPDSGVDGGSATALETPVLKVDNETNTSFEVKWDAVANATGYMVNNGTENKTVKENSFKMEKLNAGKYTVKVMALGDGQKYDNSAWASISHEVKGATREDVKDWVTREVSLPTEEDAAQHKYPFMNILDHIKGTGIAEIYYGVFSASKYASTPAVDLLKDCYKAEAEEITAANSEEGLTLVWDVEPNTEYRVIAQVINSEGFGVIFDDKKKTTEAPEQHPEMKEWLGEWTATVQETMTWTYTVNGKFDSTENKEENDKVSYDIVKEAKSVKLTIEPAPELSFNTVAIYGWTSVQFLDENNNAIPAPLYAMIDSYGYLEVVAGVDLGEVGGGYTANWLCWCYSDSKLTPVLGQFAAYYLEMGEDGNISTYRMGGGSLSDESRFEAYSLDLYAVNYDTMQMSTLYDFNEDNLVFDALAGEVTMAPYVGGDDDEADKTPEDDNATEETPEDDNATEETPEDDTTTEETPEAKAFSKRMAKNTFPVAVAAASKSMVVAM